MERPRPRKVFNGILWILASGSRWRDLPARYGKKVLADKAYSCDKICDYLLAFLIKQTSNTPLTLT